MRLNTRPARNNDLRLITQDVRVMVCCKIACTFGHILGRRRRVMCSIRKLFQPSVGGCGSVQHAVDDTASRSEKYNFGVRSPRRGAQGQADPRHPFKHGPKLSQICDAAGRSWSLHRQG